MDGLPLGANPVDPARAGLVGDPVHGDVGPVKVSEPRPEPMGRPPADGHHDMRRAGAIDQLVQLVDAAEHGDRVRLGMEDQLPAAAQGPLITRVARVDEADDRQARPGAEAQATRQPPAIAARPDD